MAFATYLPLDAEWTARDGSEWTIDRIVDMEADQDIDDSPCGGTHRLYGLALALNRHLDAGGQLTGVWQKADRQDSSRHRQGQGQSTARRQLFQPVLSAAGLFRRHRQAAGRVGPYVRVSDPGPQQRAVRRAVDDPGPGGLARHARADRTSRAGMRRAVPRHARLGAVSAAPFRPARCAPATSERRPPRLRRHSRLGRQSAAARRFVVRLRRVLPVWSAGWSGSADGFLLGSAVSRASRRAGSRLRAWILVAGRRLARLVSRPAASAATWTTRRVDRCPHRKRADSFRLIVRRRRHKSIRPPRASHEYARSRNPPAEYTSRAPPPRPLPARSTCARHRLPSARRPRSARSQTADSRRSPAEHPLAQISRSASPSSPTICTSRLLSVWQVISCRSSDEVIWLRSAIPSDKNSKG